MATETATLASGCFWCIEAVLNRVRGVQSVMPGYTGGELPNPSYEAVCTGRTGHAEAVQVVFDPDVVDFETHPARLLRHARPDDSSTARAATSARSTAAASSTTTRSQKETAEKVIKELDAEGLYGDPIVTEVTPLDVFYPAEDYHQAYYERNRDRNPYCRIVIDPKVQKLLSSYGELTKAPGAV